MIVFLSTNVVGVVQSDPNVEPTIQWADVTIQCDTASELPTYNQFQDSKKILFFPGSRAIVIDPASTYKLKSDGTWVIQDVGNDYYSKAETDALVASVDALRQGIEIEESSDLNNFNEAGAYYSPNSARTASLSNCPWTGSGFKLIVWSISGTSKMQWVMPMSNSADSIFFRSRTTTGWRPWYRLQGTAVQ